MSEPRRGDEDATDRGDGGDGPLVRATPVGRILVVGDSDRAATIAADLESAFGGDAVERTGAGDAGTRLDRADCVVCDLPSTGGIETIESLRARDDAPPILALLDDGDPKPALDAGALDVIRPSDPESVVIARTSGAIDRSGSARDGAMDRLGAFDRSDAVVLAVDEAGEVDRASPATERRLGYTPPELERTRLDRLVHPDDREAVRTTLDAVADDALGAKERVRCRLRHADGTWRVTRLTMTNGLSDPAVDGIVLTAEVAPAPPPEGTATVLDRFATPVFALGPDWEFTALNGPTAELFGRSADDLRGTVIWELLPEAVVGRCYEGFAEARATGSLVEFGVDFSPADGGLDLSVHPSAGDDGGVTVYARRRGRDSGDAAGPSRAVEGEPGSTTDAIDRDRRRLLETLLDELDDAVLVVEDGTVTLANAAAFDLTGARAVVGRTLADLFDHDLADRVEERAAAPVRRADPLEATLDRPGVDRARRVAVTVRPLPDERTACVLRDVTDRARLRRGVEILRELADGTVDAETAPAVGQRLVDELCGWLDADAVALYRRDTGGGRDETFRAVATATDPGSRPDVDLDRLGSGSGRGMGSTGPADDGLARLRAVLRSGRPTTFDGPIGDRTSDGRRDPDEADGPDQHPAGRRNRGSGPGRRGDRALAVPVGTDRVLVAVRDDRGFDDREAALAAAAGSIGAVGFASAERASEVRDLEREAARVSERSDAIATLLDRRLSLEAAVRGAESREALERSICTELAALDGVEFAWIGEPVGDEGHERLAPGAWSASGDASSADDPSASNAPAAGTNAPARAADASSGRSDPANQPPDRLAAGGADAGEPAALAAIRGERVRIDAVARDGDGAPWRREALDRDFQSALAVPVATGRLRYGALVVYGSAPGAFDDRFASVLADVAATAAYARSALDARRSLLSDRAIELELAVDGDELFTTVAARANCELELQTAVARGEGESTLFLTADGADSGAVLDALADVDAVRSARTLSGAGEDPVRFEVVVAGETIASAAVDHGGVVRSAGGASEGRLTVELHGGADVRSFVERLNLTGATVELRSQRQLDRPVERGSATACRAALRSRLTGRQREALRGAYHGGFFEWPRERTGEEVAESLGISQPTFTRHLRAAERAIVSLLFDER